jgi:hypothetical protein
MVRTEIRPAPRAAPDARLWRSKFHTAAQIRAAGAKCRLPRRQLALAYAAFLPQVGFEAATDAAVWADYTRLRALLFRFVGRGEDFSVAPAPMNAYVAQALHASGMGGADGGSGCDSN